MAAPARRRGRAHIAISTAIRPRRNIDAMRRATASLAVLVVAGSLAACAGFGGPPVRTELLGPGTYLVVGNYTSVSDTAKVLQRQMHEQADEQCPGGWTKIGEGPNPQASAGGQIWKIRCNERSIARAPAATTTAAPEVAATPPVRTTPATSGGAQTATATPASGTLLDLLATAALEAAPDLSAKAARAIARAQLRRLAAAKLTITDASGHRLEMH